MLAPSDKAPLSSSTKPKNFFLVFCIYAALDKNDILLFLYLLIIF